MASFPSIAPNTRSYDLAGDFPGVEEEAWPGASVRYRSGSTPTTAAALLLELGYLTIPSAQAQLIRDHYNGQMAGTIPFSLPALIFEGHTDPPVPPGTQWRYASEPSETQRKGGRVDVSVVLESDAYDAAAA